MSGGNLILNTSGSHANRRARTRTGSSIIMLLLASTLALAPAVVAGPDAGDEPATYLVGYAGGPPADRGQGFHGGDVVDVNRGAAFLTVETRDPHRFEERAQHDPNVRYLEVDRADAFSTTYTPDDPKLYAQWGLEDTPGIDAFTAWDTTRGSTSVTVAVIDTGLDTSHPDLGNLVPGYDFFSGDSTPEDDCGHGTHVAGTVGALTGNSRGVAGTATASIMPIKALGQTNSGCSGSFSAVANSITFATDRGADVISMSLGCAGCYSQSVEDAMAYATSRGLLVVAAAGNDGGGAVNYPASSQHAMAVSAIDRYGDLASFSSVGPEVEIAAPGVSILSTYPGNDYRYMSGTSMAAPHVSGVAALVLSASNLSGDQARDHLRATATDLGLPAGQQGAGAVDAADALAALAGSTEPAPNQAPVADAGSAQSASDADGSGDETVTLDGTGSHDADGSITSFTWYEGATQIATGATPTVTLATGDHPLTLVVTDDDGATGQDTVSISVEANQAPEASLAVSCTDLACTFDASGSVDGDGSVASYTWDLGDGTAATGAIVDHTYASGATYAVTVTVTDNGGLLDTATQEVTVAEPVTEEPTPAMHVHGIGLETKGPHLWSTVTVAGSDEQPVAGVTVAWSLCDADGNCQSFTGTSDDAGTVTDRWHKAGKGTYTACMDRLQKSGWSWEAASDHAGSGSCTTQRV